MKFDLHTHHDRCGHAEEGIRSYIEAAVQAGLHVIGISDHSPYFESDVDHANPRTAMAVSELPKYVEEVLALKREYAGTIEVLLGMECDYFPEHQETHRPQYSAYPFDYVIGSVHWSGGVKIFDRKRWNGLTAEQQVNVKETYYEIVRQCAKSGMFQIVGHLDALKANYPPFRDIPTGAVDETLRVIADSGLAIEVNTSGKTKDCGGWYPDVDILERARFHGIDVTFGSDAHKPSRVGDDLELVQRRLKEIGFRDWVFFRQKRKLRVPL